VNEFPSVAYLTTQEVVILMIAARMFAVEHRGTPEVVACILVAVVDIPAVRTALSAVDIRAVVHTAEVLRIAVDQVFVLDILEAVDYTMVWYSVLVVASVLTQPPLDSGT